MEFFSRSFRGLARRFLPPGNTEQPFESSRLDAYLHVAYRVLAWEDPRLSCLTLGGLYVLLWLVVQWELRFYGIIFMGCLLMFVVDFCCDRKDVQAEPSESSDAMRQMGYAMKRIILYLRDVRRDNPLAFCFSMCGVFLGALAVAMNVPGFALANLVLLAIFTGPLLVSRIPPEYLANFKGVVETFSTNEGLLAESELLPFISNKDLNEQDADLDSLLTDKTADSVTNSLISGITSMPSHLDAEGGSLDGLEEEDLEFTMRSNNAVSYTPGETSSDSDSDHKSMGFESSHFNRDSSSEDEQHYAKGLQFSEVSRDLADTSKTKRDSNNQAMAAGILGNLTSLGSTLITNVLKTAVTTNAPKQKDSDSEFEIIGPDDIDE